MSVGAKEARALFEEDMKVAETEVRLMAMQHISKVAQLLGPQATIEEFLPQLEQREFFSPFARSAASRPPSFLSAAHLGHSLVRTPVSRRRAAVLSAPACASAYQTGDSRMYGPGRFYFACFAPGFRVGFATFLLTSPGRLLLWLHGMAGPTSCFGLVWLVGLVCVFCRACGRPFSLSRLVPPPPSLRSSIFVLLGPSAATSTRRHALLFVSSLLSIGKLRRRRTRSCLRWRRSWGRSCRTWSVGMRTRARSWIV